MSGATTTPRFAAPSKPTRRKHRARQQVTWDRGPGRRTSRRTTCTTPPMQAGSNNNFALAIDLFQRVAKADPKHKGLWNGLGAAYLSTNQNEQAVDAFKKQIEINPYDEFAYQRPRAWPTRRCSITTKPSRNIRSRSRSIPSILMRTAASGCSTASSSAGTKPCLNWRRRLRCRTRTR